MPSLWTSLHTGQIQSWNKVILDWKWSKSARILPNWLRYVSRF
jgi:hypothetical protein